MALDFETLDMGSKENIQYRRYRPAFILNDAYSNVDEIWRKNDGFVVNISDIHFLPDDCAGLKLEISIVDA